MDGALSLSPWLYYIAHVHGENSLALCMRTIHPEYTAGRERIDFIISDGNEQRAFSALIYHLMAGYWSAQFLAYEPQSRSLLGTNGKIWVHVA